MKRVLISGVVLAILISIAGISYAATCNFSGRTIEEKKEILNTRVEEGVITPEQANEIETKIENCDGTGQEKIGQEYNVSFGTGNHQYQEDKSEHRNGNGSGNGQGQGQGHSGKNGTGICRRISQ